ncbi:hypothetical protein FACS1894181_12790 [Bacteroidia bacterium]|nr:hypothetical protein FACS1894181_12790 [Bacteroidia bacterium]
MRAQTSIDYIDANGNPQTVTATAITDGSPLDNNWYYVSGTVEVTGRITVTGNVRLILEDDCDFKANGGIQVEGSNRLTIYNQTNGSGKLTAQANVNENAGIGGNLSGSAGTITINGGKVEANGSSSRAGIGGQNSLLGSPARITITGGTIKATGNGGGKDIGNGYTGTDGSVTITGGSIHATNGSISPLPVNGTGADVYLNTLELSGVSAVTLVTAGSINGISCANTPVVANGVYGIKNVQTDAAGNVYFYLPASGNSGTDGETIRLADGSGYYQETFARPANSITAETLNKEVTAADILGVTPPVAGVAPVTTITETAEYTGAVSWSPADNPFGYATSYTATITLTPKPGYTLAGVAADFFTVTGTTATNNTGGVVTAVFPVTAPPPTYGITGGSFTGGSVSANRTLAAAGEIVTLTVYPASGYELSAIRVHKTGDASVSVALNGFNGFNGLNGDFTMPDYGVTMLASFSEIPPPEPDPDAVALDAMIYSIRNLHVIVPQEEANTESEVAYWLRDSLARLFEDKGWDITVQKLTVVNFFPATAGTRTDVPGTNGSFSFFAILRKGYVTDRTYNMDGTVTATSYTTPVGNESAEVGTSVYFRNHTLYICSPVAETVEVYSFSGAKLLQAKKEAGEAFFTVQAGDKAVIVRGSSGWTRKAIDN